MKKIKKKKLMIILNLILEEFKYKIKKIMNQIVKMIKQKLKFRMNLNFLLTRFIYIISINNKKFLSSYKIY